MQVINESYPSQFIKVFLLLLICSEIMGQRCQGAFKEIISEIEKNKKVGEIFDVIVAEFETRDIKEWFNESKIAKKVENAIAKGVKMVQESESSIRYLGMLSATGPLYTGLKSRAEGDRKAALSEVVDMYNGNAIIFGYYEGGDYTITIEPYMYSAVRNVLVKGDKTTFKRTDSDVLKKITYLTIGLFLKVFEAS